MLIALKMLCAVLYVGAFWLGLPLLIVGTVMLAQHVLGDVWWVDVLLAPVVLGEFVGVLSFFLWDDNPIPQWITEA